MMNRMVTENEFKWFTNDYVNEMFDSLPQNAKDCVLKDISLEVNRLVDDEKEMWDDAIKRVLDKDTCDFEIYLNDIRNNNR